MTYSLENFLRAAVEQRVAVSVTTSAGFTLGFALHHCSRPFSSNRTKPRRGVARARVAAATAASRRCVDAARTRRTSANAT